MHKLNHFVGIYFGIISITGVAANIRDVQTYLLQFSILDPLVVFQYVFFFGSSVLAILLSFSSIVFLIKNKHTDFRLMNSVEKTFSVSLLVLFFSSLGWWVCVLLFGQYAGMLIMPMILNAALIVITALLGMLSVFNIPVNSRALLWTLFIFFAVAVLFFFLVLF